MKPSHTLLTLFSPFETKIEMVCFLLSSQRIKERKLNGSWKKERFNCHVTYFPTNISNSPMSLRYGLRTTNTATKKTGT